ncbi:MAG: hypothetical protein IT517_03380, partial [Burkholderiales bacterium]|nr:hypothetical protein [Burkholderiales bacterium]
RAGDTINGVTVADVRADRVKLVMGDESEELVLKVASGPRTTIQPPHPGAPGAPGPQSPAGAVPPGAPVPPGQARPAVPAGAPPGAAQQQVGALPTMQPSQSGLTEAEAQLLERRRAARAAQAAAAAAGGAAPATNSPATPGAADPAWAEVYRRMQQPRR